MFYVMVLVPWALVRSKLSKNSIQMYGSTHLTTIPTIPEHGDERKADRIPSHFNAQITSWVVSMYTQMCVGRKEESKELKTIWEEEIGDL
jgi:hypothetical protein